MINKVSEMIFEDIFTDKRYRYPAFNGRYSFNFNQAVDDRPYKANQNYDIGVRILTPWYEGGNDDLTLRMMAGQKNEVLASLPKDTAFLDEIRQYLKIEKFLRLNTSTQLAKYEMIKEAKRVEMRERNANAKIYLTESLKEATIYVNGDVPHISAKEVSARISEAIGRLVQTVYNKLSYITAAMSEAEIRKMFHSSNSMTLGLDGAADANTHALDDVLQFIASNTDMHMKTSMKTVKDRFMKAPYGFVEDDVHWLVARLFKRGDLAFTVNGASVNQNNKTEEDLIGFITKKTFVEKLLLEKRIRVNEKDKRAVRDVMKELFGTAGAAEDEDSIMKNFQRYAQNMVGAILPLEPQYEKYAYPGKIVLDTGKRLMQQVSQMQSPLDFFRHVSGSREDFYDFAEDYEPVKTFFNGEQKQIFAEALDMLAIYDDSKTYIVDEDLEKIAADMRHIVQQDKPYQNIPKLPELRRQFLEAYMKILTREEKPVLDAVEQARDRVMEILNTKEYAASKRQKYMELFAEIKDGAEHCNNVSFLRSFADKADALKIRLMNEMDEADRQIACEKAMKAKKEAEEAARKAKEEGRPIPEQVAEEQGGYKVKKIKNVTIKNMTNTSSWRLESEQDVDKYLAALRKSLLEELKETDIVNVEF